jgi:hypothetical protein
VPSDYEDEVDVVGFEREEIPIGRGGEDGADPPPGVDGVPRGPRRDVERSSRKFDSDLDAALEDARDREARVSEPSRRSRAELVRRIRRRRGLEWRERVAVN